MKLVAFTCRGRTSIGKLAGTQVIDLHGADPLLPATMCELLARGSALLGRARRVEPEPQ